MIEIINEKCTGCSVCLQSCPFAAISMDADKAKINLDVCTLCGACVSNCPFEAIILKKETTVSVDKSLYTGVWVYAEQRENKISPVVYELLGKGRELADKRKTKLVAVLMGHQVGNLTQDLIEHGADEVILVENELLKDFTDLPYSDVFTQLIVKHKPEIILAGATHVGRSFIPRVAVKVHTGLTADCTGLDIEESTGNLLQTRPAFGGNIMATIQTVNHRPQIATVRHKVMTPLAKDTARKGVVIKEDIALAKDKYNTQFKTTKKDTTSKINLSDANIVIAGGRGMKESKNFEMLHNLAELLDGAVGASRAAVDSEWVTYPHQVGQTGKTIKPKIYVAFGISGAIQHMAGMQSADYIIAINKDKDAPIFHIADMGVVGDIFEILPLLISKFKSG